MSWHIYIAQCADESLYTGIAKDVQKRISQHNKGKGAKYTRSRRPVVLKASWPAASHSEALKVEYRIKRLNKAEKIRLIYPDMAYNYAKEVVNGRWVEGEFALAMAPTWAYQYAKDILKGRWPEAEPYIIKDTASAYLYAKNVIKARWPEAEPLMVKSPHSCLYTLSVIKERWPAAEAVIAKSDYKQTYLDAFPEAAEDWALNGWIDWLDT